MADISGLWGWFGNAANDVAGSASGWFRRRQETAMEGLRGARESLASPGWRYQLMNSYYNGLQFYPHWRLGINPPPTLLGRVGYFAGIGTPLLAGAAAFSGLNNIRRGRYGRGLLHLALGAGLVGAMYGASHWRPWEAGIPMGPIGPRAIASISGPLMLPARTGE